MLVGEPTLMGGELGDEDERLITRLENTQYKPSSDDEPDYKPNVNQSHQLYSSHAPLPMHSGWPQESSSASVLQGVGDSSLPPSNG
jgi:hypothetical protein